MSQSELLKKVIAVLDRVGAAYMLTGSWASSLQGEPRLTHDIDLVVQITQAAADELIRHFPPPDYYLSDIAVADAIVRKGQFNLLDINSGDKVDFWMLSDDPFDQSRFSRRYADNFEGTRILVSRAEDTIIMKMRWAQMSGGSEKQIGDARGVYQLQRDSLDIDYIAGWVRTLALEQQWGEVTADAG